MCYSNCPYEKFSCRNDDAGECRGWPGIGYGATPPPDAHCYDGDDDDDEDILRGDDE